MKIMDEEHLLRKNFKITLAGLFKKQIRVKMIKSLENTEKRKGENSQHIIFRALFPVEYRRMSDGTDISEVDSTRISRFFTYYIDPNKGKADADNQYYAIKDNILRITKKVGFNFSDFELLIKIKNQLISMFSGLSEEEIKDFQDDAKALIKEFKQNKILSPYTEAVQKLDFYDQLSCLVVIASTWACWDNIDTRDASALALILLPTISASISSSKSEYDWKEEHISQERTYANELLTQCRSDFEHENYSTCVKRAQKIITMVFADDSTLGEAYYYLSICHSKSNNNSSFDKTLMIQSAKLGFSKAYEQLRNSEEDHGTPVLWRPLSETHGFARIIFNAQNRFTEEFLLSVPAEMQTDTIYKEMILSASGKEQLQMTVDSSKETRYLLFDENQEKNFKDLLYILDKISSIEKKTAVNPFLSSKRWSKTTIHIRVSEDKYSALIDTALKRLGDFIIRVFIIDDEKRAAQALLADYPLYNELRGLSQDTLIKGPVTLNFTIICNADTSLATRLIRESYWISCFSYPGLTVKLNLISPQAAEVKQELRLNFPSMFVNIPDASHTSSIRVLDEMFEISSISDYRLIQHFDAIEATKNSFNYYVIDIGDDVSNLNLAIQLREWSIRNKIDNGKRPQNKTLPTIAFYCRDSDIAYLSQNMVVQAVNHGDKWHNNYNLVPFGMLHDYYSWNAIDGGYWEKVAESTHLQYCGIKSNAASVEKISCLTDYFSRNYNRDSSMAVALSLPYRLFQVRNSTDEHIIPYAPIDNLNLSNENADIIDTMAEQFRMAIKDPSDKSKITNALLYSEHVRWIRWAYSRGWKSASPEQVLLYMNAGNPKQQLYIARLHGCLCSIADLQILSEKMVEELLPTEDGNVYHQKDWKRFAARREKIFQRKVSNERVFSDDYEYIPKNFTEIDSSNILATADIIQTLWFDSKTAINIIEPSR